MKFTNPRWTHEPHAQTEPFAITLQKVACARCKQDASMTHVLSTPGGPTFCHYCVREALVRMTAELEK